MNLLSQVLFLMVAYLGKFQSIWKKKYEKEVQLDQNEQEKLMYDKAQRSLFKGITQES
jgi:hypothetical protein